ncbi:MAG: V-type ATP synthase subunit E [Ruminococcus sp.]|nr:V-type ATP synthase subunit E [Ruminococcus sp.]
MSGLDEILNIIEAQQKDNEDRMISAAESKARQIKADGDEKAAKAYDDYMARAEVQYKREFENACNSADSAMKRRLLACRVECIDKAVARTVEKLNSLPDKEYFALLEKLITRRMTGENGTLYLGKRDLSRIPADFADRLNAAARSHGGSLTLSDTAADIADGFILEYGLISENCSFGAILEAEREGVRDTAARALFG